MATSAVVNPTSATRGDTKVRGASAQGGQLRLYRYTSDSIAAAGNSELDLAAATDWDWNAAKIHQIIVQASASTDFDIEIYGEDGFTANEHYYKNENNNLVMNDKPLGGLFYIDRDATREFHLKIINTDAGNASTFDVFMIISPISNI
jgi:hypothetical protein|tara:strand:- start:366 stop:809 length:444 start_codon:yes stop_codon:yes gene_type:complete